MPLLTREQILTADDRKRERVETPEWGEGAFIFVQTLTGLERDAYEVSLSRSSPIVGPNGRPAQATIDLLNARAKLVVLAACDEDGTRIFTDEDVDALGKKSSLPIDRAFQKAALLSSVNPSAEQSLGEASAPGPSAGNGTA